MRLHLCLSFLCLALLPVHAFVQNPSCSSRSDDVHLFGLAEWRERTPISADDTDADRIPRPILMLPFAANDLLLPGQSTTIVLKEGRFYDLFQDAIDDHASIVGTAIMAEDGLLTCMPLCEIADFDVEAGYRGKVTVTVTLRAVGRARMLKLTQMKPVMMGSCVEVWDDPISPEADVSLAQDLVQNIESVIGVGSDTATDVSKKYREAVDFALSVADDTSATSDWNYLTAASWAVFPCTLNTSFQEKALATTSVIDRLELGLKALMDKQYQTSNAQSENIFGDESLDKDIGFE